MKKIIVAHPGVQHSIRLVDAIAKSGDYDLTYITSLYDKDTVFFNSFFKLFMSKKNKIRFKKRKSSILPDSKVVQFCVFSGLLRTFLAHFDKKQTLFHWYTCRMANSFGKKVARYAIKHSFDIVICYDTFSCKCFEIIKRNHKNIITIMDASAANMLYQKEIFISDINKELDFSSKLLNEVGFAMNDDMSEYYKREIINTDYIIAASNYTKNSFIFSKFNKNNIFVIPYGIDINKFSYVDRKINDIINFVYVGGTKQSKGLSYLIKAFNRLPKDKCSLTIVGVNNLPQNLQKQYFKNVKFTGLILNDEVINVLSESHVMVFPSLSDGFGFAGIEAMATGCPVISSCNAGVADFINDFENGFVIPIQDENAIFNKMKWFIDNPKMINVYGKKAHNSVKDLSWDKYNEGILNMLNEIRGSADEG